MNDFAQLEINVEIFHRNEDSREYVDMVPTSAHTGDGMGDLMAFLCQEMQQKLRKRLTFSEELKANVMEVRITVFFILVDWRLRDVISRSFIVPSSQFNNRNSVCDVILNSICLLLSKF